MTNFDLNQLETIIKERKTESPENSYTAYLFKAGVQKCSEKLGEEIVELIVAAVTKDKSAAIHEAADVIYHLLVLLQTRDISSDEVMIVLEERTAQSGFAEKAARTNPNKK